MKHFSLFLSFFLLSHTAASNIAGSDLQNFNPTSNGLDFITVQSSRTLDPLLLNLGTFITYTTNSLPYATDSTVQNNQTFSEPNDRLLYSHIHFGLGLMEGWDFGVNAGFLNAQDIEETNFLFSYGDTGIDDIRINTKFRLYHGDSVGLAIMASADFDQIKNNPFAGSDPGPSYNLEAIGDVYINPRWLWSINMGYRVRNAGAEIINSGVQPMPNQVVYSTAMSYQTTEAGSAVIGELYGSYPIDTFTLPTDRDISNLEAILAYRWRPLPDFDFHSGLGTEIYHGLGSPDFRIFLGMNFRLGFLNSQKNQPPQTWNPESSGTSKEGDHLDPKNSMTETKDSDGDGIGDEKDQCPNTTPETRVNAFGCEIKESNISAE